MESIPGLPPNTTNAPTLLILNYTLTGVALLLVVLRSFVRIHIVKGWGWDDTIIIISWLCLVNGCALTQIENDNGRGRHIWYLPYQKVLDILKFIPFYQLNILMNSLITKLSISFFILRIKDTRRIRWALVIMMTLMTLATLQSVIVLLTYCLPLKKLWIPSTPGRCLPFDRIMISGYVQSAFTIIIDFALSISPFVILWDIKINAQSKILICVLMSLGLTATISNGLRNRYMWTLHSIDFTYDLFPLIVCVTLETTLGVICACIPACWPIFRWIRAKVDPQPSAQPSLDDFFEKSRILKSIEIEITVDEVSRDESPRRPSSAYKVHWNPPTPNRISTLIDGEKSTPRASPRMNPT